MKIVVCVRQATDGELGAFDACAYEAALNVPNAEVILLSMGPASCESFLLSLTRLGAKKAVLLTDRVFAGADTIATAYALSLAVKKLEPDMVFCGRQTFVGDTGQVGPMLASMLGYTAITNAMKITASETSVICDTRTEGECSVDYPALITVERINKLRLPSIRSKLGECEVWSAADIGAEPSKCGLEGSPTRVMKTYKNESGKRKCRFLELEKLPEIIELAKNKQNEKLNAEVGSGEKLSRVICVGNAAEKMAKTVSDDVTVIQICPPDEMAEIIKTQEPNAVIFGSDTESKRISAETAAILGLGLCADCTMLDTEDGELIMYRPAAAGSVIAKIKSLTKPAMATVRTEDKNQNDIIVAVGFGAKNDIGTVKAFADKLSAGLGASRKAVDNELMEYSNQVGLTGKTVSPPIYIAVGISGAVHHIVGMQGSGTVIAINLDKQADIFEYADYGILCEAAELEKLL